MNVPLLGYERHRARKGKVSNGVLVTEDRDTGRVMFGVVTDIAEECAASAPPTDRSARSWRSTSACPPDRHR